MKRKLYFIGAIVIAFCTSTVSAQTYPTSGLISYWDFDQQFMSAQNIPINPFNAGAVNWEANRAGVANDAFTVNGNQKLEVLGTDAASFRTPTLTISAWAKINTTPVLSYPFIARQSDNGYVYNSYCLGIVNDGSNSTYYAQLKFANTPTSLFAVPIDLATINGVWRHFAMTYNGNVLRIYMDGEMLGEWTPGQAIDYPSNVVDPEFASLNGGFDDLAYYDRALSPAEIKHLYWGTTVAGDVNQNGVIDGDEIAGDSNFDYGMSEGEVAGDVDGNGVIDNTGEGGPGGEIAGDINGNGTIDNGEIIGDINGNETIDAGEVNGDANGNGVIDGSETTTASLNEKQEQLFSVYPNPTKDMVTISNKNELFEFQIVNSTGAIIESGSSFSSTQLDFSHLAQGVYFLKLKANQKNETVLLVKE